LGLIGYPLAHSLSPRLHSAALQAMRLAGVYRLYPVPPLPEGEELFHDLLERLRNNELRGLNVTIPHKQAIIPYLDELSPTASAIGAVNTVFVQDGRLVGMNTDAPGFLSDLEKFLRIAAISVNTTFLSEENHVVKKSAILLGAGGAARAVTYALLHTGWEVTIAARRLEQAQDIADTLQLATTNLQTNTLNLESSTTIGSINIIPLNKSSIIDLKPKLVVNATPVGMWPEVNACPWPEGVSFPTGALVYDLVYNPVETALMRAARREGLPVANGLGMLIEQAALALEIWTGQPVPRQSMLEAMTELSGSPPD
jgi:shikimate dehydrogenase